MFWKPIAEIMQIKNLGRLGHKEVRYSSFM